MTNADFSNLPINSKANEWIKACCQKLGFNLKYGGKAKRLKGYFKPILIKKLFKSEKSGFIRLFEDSVQDRLLFTAIHELAHGVVWLDFPNQKNIKSHGIEWKATFSDLLQFAIEQHFFKQETVPFLLQHLNGSIFACSGGDVQLEEYFIRQEEEHSILLMDIPVGSTFKMESMTLIKGRKLKKRYECKEIHSHRLYRVHPLVKVDLLF